MTNRKKVQWERILDTMSRARNGDTAAFSQLAEQYGPLMGGNQLPVCIVLYGPLRSPTGGPARTP